MTTIYVDVVVLENVWMNAIILIATGMWLKKKNHIKRILLASFVGAVFVLISYGKIFSGFANILFKIVISILMVQIAFPTRKKQEFLQTILLFYFVSFLFGGCALMWTFVFQSNQTQMKNGIWQIKGSVFTILLSAVVGLSLWKIGMQIMQKKEQKRIYDLELWFRGKKKNVKAFFDTGNALKDPITKEPVLILEETCFQDLTGKSIQTIWEEIEKGEEAEIQIRMIPFQSIGKKSGTLFVMPIDQIFLEEQEIKKENVLVGIYEGCFSKRGEYQALIGADILERSTKKYGFTTNFKKSS